MKGVKRFKGIHMKIILYFVTSFFIISLITGIVQYNINSEALFEDAKINVIKLAKAGALLIDGDRHEKLLVEEDMLGEDYKIIRSEMQDFMKETEVSSIYTLTKLGNDKTQFIVDADAVDQPLLGEEYHYMPDMEPAFQGTASAEADFYTDAWGTVVSGYAPLKNSDGEIVAIVAADLDVNYILQQNKELIGRLVMSSLIGMILMIIISIIISRKITKPINTLVKDLSDRFTGIHSDGGDLTKSIEIKTGDEIELLADSMSNFIGNIRKAIIQVKETGENVSTSANALNTSVNENLVAVDEVSTAIESIAAGATDQASDIGNIASGIQSIAADVNENEKKINNINDATELTKKLIDNGLEAINNQSIKSDESMKAFENVIAVVKKLTAGVANIENILSKITDISEQTNLLALNAAIEAARAGEQGKGFSVVAEEVKKLAEESSISAQEISQILHSINIDVQETVEQIDNSNSLAIEQRDAVSITSDAFNDITKEVENIIDAIELINTSFKVIGDNTNDISDKIQNVSAVSQENAAISEEVSASSEEQSATMHEMGETARMLNDLSIRLEEVIANFKVE